MMLKNAVLTNTLSNANPIGLGTALTTLLPGVATLSLAGFILMGIGCWISIIGVPGFSQSFTVSHQYVHSNSALHLAGPGSPAFHHGFDSSNTDSDHVGLDRGQQLYQQHCSRCHGVQGEGTSDYDDRLIGDLAVSELADYIHDTMPEDDPEACQDEEAKLIAAYMHAAFYSPSAQRNRLSGQSAPQPQFSRLTVAQFRQAVSDIVANFGDPIWETEERGLRGFYFAARGWREKRKLSEQIDPQIDFPERVPHFDPTDAYPQLGEKPKAENKMGDGFTVYWHGSIKAPRTGQYTILVESKNGFELKLNRQDIPLIDRRVRSDEVERHEANIYLIAGKNYPLQIELFSYPDPPAQIQLKWIPPDGSEEVIPQAYLVPHRFPHSLAVATPFPADDASSGYQRGISISQDWDASVTGSAIEAADWIADHLWELVGAKATDEDRIEKVKLFCQRFVQYALVKPLDENEQEFFVDQHFRDEAPLTEQVKRVVWLTLKSPRFLYPTLQPRPDDFQIAATMAQLMWDSIPDPELFDAAVQGRLQDGEHREQQLWRMAANPRFQWKFRQMLEQWLELDKAINLEKDNQRFPDFDPLLQQDLRRSLELFLDHVARQEGIKYKDLFETQQVFANQRLANFYGWDWPSNDDTDTNPIEHRMLTVEGQASSGLLTHPYLMARLAHYQESSPIHRGVFVARKLFGRMLKQPTENFEPFSEELHPDLTNRQRVELQTGDAVCMGCHRIINPLGFSLEHFDAVGRYRTHYQQTTGQYPIDATSNYIASSGESVLLSGESDLKSLLIDDAAAKKFFIQQMFNYQVRQPIEAFGNGTTTRGTNEDALETIYRNAGAENLNLKMMLVEIAKVVLNH